MVNGTAARLKSALWYAPSALLVLLVFVYPICRTVALSFAEFNLASGLQPRFSGLANFARLGTDSRFFGSLGTTSLFAAASVVLEFALGLLLAMAVQSIRTGRQAVRTILLIPWTLPTAVIAVLWMWIFNDQYGVLNALLLGSGIVRAPVPWLAGPATALWAMIIADVWKAFPFVLIILMAGLQSIPQELYEAIEIDGGNAWHRFRYVTLPYLLPFMFLALIFRFVQAFAVFDLVYVMTGGGPGGATETVSVYSYYTFMRYLDFGYGSSLVLATVVLLGLVAWGLHRLLVRSHEVHF